MLKEASILVSLALAGALSVGSTMAATADEAAQEAIARHLAAGTLEAGADELSAMITRDGDNQDARFGLGMVRFVGALEHLSQGLYRYGLMPSRRVPIMRLPVPPNPDPETIAYEDFRDLLQALIDDLAEADAALAAVDDSPVKIPIDLREVAYDIDGDRIAGPEEHLTAALAALSGMRDGWLPDGAVAAFDYADALWLRGYCHVFMAVGEFLLAHEWRASFEASFHQFFPDVDSEFATALAAPDDPNGLSRPQYDEIADAISFVHLLRWPVVEPERMTAALDHIGQILTLSRQTWDAIEAEDDDDREWLPGPDQLSAVVTLTVTDEQVAEWRAMLDEAEAVVSGDKLLPHWRFDQGINFRKAFESPRTFDLVLWITGPAALPYLEDGPISTSTDWRRMMRTFGRGFGAYLIWFN